MEMEHIYLFLVIKTYHLDVQLLVWEELQEFEKSSLLRLLQLDSIEQVSGALEEWPLYMTW